MLPVHVTTVRLFVHVLAATVWVGGQLTLAGLLPVLRGLGPEATRAAARQFDRLAWPAFALLVATGVWNLFEVEIGSTSIEYQISVAVKLTLVAASGIGAAAHRRTHSKAILAVGGAASAIGALGALFIGIQLRS
jgi:putative copper export protein